MAEQQQQQQHPITPPEELVQKWLTEGHHQDYCSAANHAIAQAARWGDEQRLEVCIAWLHYNYPSVNCEALYAAMRPKPPSLAEQALTNFGCISALALEEYEGCEVYPKYEKMVKIIHSALERLQELEKGNE